MCHVQDVTCRLVLGLAMCVFCAVNFGCPHLQDVSKGMQAKHIDTMLHTALPTLLYVLANMCSSITAMVQHSNGMVHSNLC